MTESFTEKVTLKDGYSKEERLALPVEEAEELNRLTVLGDYVRDGQGGLRRRGA